MSVNNRSSADDQEIDLSDISRKVGNAFQSLNTAIFRGIQFVIKNAIILGILIVVGVALGFYLDKTQKTYDHQIIVTPNFGSVDYLYSKIDLLDAKIKERDTTFLKKIGLSPSVKISRIKIEPIVDIYRFINNSSNEQNFQLFKLMAEDGDIKKIVEEPATSKNYTYHAISLSTRNKATMDGTIKPLLDYLNNSAFFKKVQVEYIRNTTEKMRANQQMIDQIDGILNQLATRGSGSSQIYISENTQLNDVIKTKDNLVEEQGNRRIEMVSIDKIIKDNTIITNIENNEAVNGKLKIILPLLFVFLFIVVRLVRSFYRTQSQKVANLA